VLDQYCCTNCNLSFQLGFICYSEDSEYESQHFLVCKDCGVQYELFTLKPSKRKDSQTDERKDGLFYQLKPCYRKDIQLIGTKLEHETESDTYVPKEIPLTLPGIKWGEKHEDLEFNYEKGWMAKYQCHHCKNVNSLSFKWKKKYKCPKCQNRIDRIGSVNLEHFVSFDDLNIKELKPKGEK